MIVSAPTSNLIAGAFCTPALRIIDPFSGQLTPKTDEPMVTSISKPIGKWMCNFCKQNGEPFERYTSHPLRDNKAKIVVCPILRSHVCPFCQETGDFAHTISYCQMAKTFKPIAEELHGDDAFSSNMGELRKTNFSAAGQRVYSANKILLIKSNGLN